MKPLSAFKSILNGFPHSQHRPVLLEIGLCIPFVLSFPGPRWNFSKADWDKYRKRTDSIVRWIEPIHSNYGRFVNMITTSAKKTIPRGFRKKYVPGWSDACSTLYEEFKITNDPEIANKLLSLLDDIRKEKWDESLESMDFSRSSRKAWNTLRKLSPTSSVQSTSYDCNVNKIASRLVKMSKVPIDKNFGKEIKLKLKRKMSSNTLMSSNGSFSSEFTVNEIKVAISSIKNGKAAGVDGIYNEFLINLGQNSIIWLAKFYSNILDTGRIPSIFLKAKILAIKKPGKKGDSAEDFRPISLLCTCYKLLERLLFNRISPKIYECIPNEQAGFRPDRSCCDQVLALTTYIEIGFQQKKKTGTAFIDLSAAYDTVWRHGLLYKLIDVIPSYKLIVLLNNMLANRIIQVFLGSNKSRPRRLNDGLPQGSVLAPLLFILYISDLPETKSNKFIYADDISLASQHESFDLIEEDLNKDLLSLWCYFKKWRLRPNETKSEVNVYHLSNHLADKTLVVTVEGTHIKNNPFPKYLGVVLDRSLTYKNHIESIKRKIKSRINIINNLAGTSWGASFNTLKTTALALVYSVAEYCSPVWLNSQHSSKIDIEINKCMRIISGSVSSTPNDWLPVLCNIAPPSLRRENHLYHQWKKISLNPNLPLYNYMLNLPPERLVSRNASYSSGLQYFNGFTFDMTEHWKNSWYTSNVQNTGLVLDPNIVLPGTKLPRKLWVTLNRFRSGHGRCASMLYKWNLSTSHQCDCGHPFQTMTHIVNNCRKRFFFGRLEELHLATDDALTWLENLDLKL